jgi:CRISPR/Cas system-associated endonuclease/helicase Cas3
MEIWPKIWNKNLPEMFSAEMEIHKTDPLSALSDISADDDLSDDDDLSADNLEAGNGLKESHKTSWYRWLDETMLDKHRKRSATLLCSQ